MVFYSQQPDRSRNRVSAPTSEESQRRVFDSWARDLVYGVRTPARLHSSAQRMAATYAAVAAEYESALGDSEGDDRGERGVLFEGGPEPSYIRDLSEDLERVRRDGAEREEETPQRGFDRGESQGNDFFWGDLISNIANYPQGGIRMESDGAALSPPGTPRSVDLWTPRDW